MSNYSNPDIVLIKYLRFHITVNTKIIIYTHHYSYICFSFKASVCDIPDKLAYSPGIHVHHSARAARGQEYRMYMLLAPPGRAWAKRYRSWHSEAVAGGDSPSANFMVLECGGRLGNQGA